MTPIPLRLFVWMANLSFQFGLILLSAAVISIVLKTDSSGWRRRLWQAVFFAPPFFSSLNILFPSAVVPLLSLPVSASRVMPITVGSGPGSSAGAFPALVMPMISPLLSCLGLIGLLGAAGSALGLVSGLIAAFRIGRRGETIENERVLGWGREAALKLGCRRPIKLRTSRRIAVPAVLGLFRPIIVLPQNFLAWTEAELKPVLAHEISHVKHRDPLGRTLARVVCALNWFNPAAWLALGRLIAEQEIEGDRAAVSCGARPSDYAEILLRRLAPHDARRRFSLASFGDGAAWKARMRALLLPVFPSRTTRGRRIALGALLAGLILAPGAFSLWDAAEAGPRTVMIHRGRPPRPESASVSDGTQKTRIWMDPATHRWDYF